MLNPDVSIRLKVMLVISRPRTQGNASDWRARLSHAVSVGYRIDNQ